MKGRLFLVHWKEQAAQQRAAPLLAQGWRVDIEAEDGARAGRAIKAQPPDAVLISLTRLPSHGRETADYLQSAKAPRSIPLLFLDSTAEAVAIRYEWERGLRKGLSSGANDS